MLNIFLVSLILSTASCVTHWKITNTGRIESNDDSAFALLRPYDLAAFIKQVDRQERLDNLKRILASKETITKRDNYKNTPISVANYQENFYKTDADCINAGQQLSKFSFYETHFITWRSEAMRLPKSVTEIQQADVKVFKKPYCDVVDLPFTMGTFDHLESIKSKLNITMLPETELSSNLIVDSEEFFGHLVYKSLNMNSSSWVFLTMASDYFRVKGDYLNAINCLQRAIHYSPKNFQSIPLLNLSNMLHKLRFINDSLIVGLTGVSIDSNNPLLVYYVANIYVTLGELNTSYVWFNRASQMDTNFRQALLKKYAVNCHIKLQLYLEEQHFNLQKKLDELNNFQGYSDEWFQLNNKLMLEKSSLNRKKFTQNAYKEFINNSKSTICNWQTQNTNEFSIIKCKKLPLHYTHFPFHNYTKLLEYLEDYQAQSSLHLNYNASNKNLNTCTSTYKCPGKDKRKEFQTGSVRINRGIVDALSTNLDQVLQENMEKNVIFVLESDDRN